MNSDSYTRQRKAAIGKRIAYTEIVINVSPEVIKSNYFDL
jgi:hypothetical protein